MEYNMASPVQFSWSSLIITVQR